MAACGLHLAVLSSCGCPVSPALSIIAPKASRWLGSLTIDVDIRLVLCRRGGLVLGEASRTEWGDRLSDGVQGPIHMYSGVGYRRADGAWPTVMLSTARFAAIVA